MIPNFADHASNERTFLAWVRTVVAIEGFGIVAARVGDGTAGGWTEVLLLMAGGIVILLAFARMRRIRYRIDSAETVDDEAVSADLFLLLVVVALFGLIGAFALNVF